MHINFNDLVKAIDTEKEHSSIINTFIKELEEGLKIMNDKEMQEYTVDRFEGNIAVCENRKTKEILNVNKENLPQEAREGSILTYRNGKFSLDEEKTQEISKRIKEKMNNLWNN